ncbi:uncharacterized protein [Bemisia tabaci]|uniref:uncharacterized protein n=1 Tax=Bemisia tabaci TaxID=7038 RepID=UPI003B287E1A
MIMISSGTHLIVLCGVFVLLVDRGQSFQQPSGFNQQTPRQQPGGFTRQKPNYKCALLATPGGSNGQDVMAGGKDIMHDEPCKGFGPHTRSHQNSGRREGCRKAAYALAQIGARTECGMIVHGQCIQAPDGGDAACYVLGKKSDGTFVLKLLKDCADPNPQSPNQSTPSTGATGDE